MKERSRKKITQVAYHFYRQADPWGLCPLLHIVPEASLTVSMAAAGGPLQRPLYPNQSGRQLLRARGSVCIRRHLTYIAKCEGRDWQGHGDDSPGNTLIAFVIRQGKKKNLKKSKPVDNELQWGGFRSSLTLIIQLRFTGRNDCRKQTGLDLIAVELCGHVDLSKFLLSLWR